MRSVVVLIVPKDTRVERRGSRGEILRANGKRMALVDFGRDRRSRLLDLGLVLEKEEI